MKPQQPNIFESTACPSAEDLQAYAAQELDHDRQHDVERHLQDCALCSDAAEGFAFIPVSAASIESLNQEATQLAFQPTPGPGSGGGTTTYWLMGLGAAAVIATVFWLMPGASEPAPEPLVTEQVAPAPPEEHFIAPDPVEDEPTEPAIEVVETPEATPAPTAEPTPAEPLEQPVVVEEAVEEPTERPEPVDPAPALPLPAPKQEPPADELPVDRQELDIRWIENYKTVDYSEEYTEPLRRAEVVPNSLSPQFEDRAAQERYEPETVTFTYEYEDVLELGIFRLKAGKYDKALRKFDLILGQYPEDENALFYGGLCHYNRQRAKKAIEFFTPVAENEGSTFQEEAEWYLALAYRLKGNSKEASRRMKIIAEKGGFYSERAAQQRPAR